MTVYDSAKYVLQPSNITQLITFMVWTIKATLNESVLSLAFLCFAEKRLRPYANTIKIHNRISDTRYLGRYMIFKKHNCVVQGFLKYIQRCDASHDIFKGDTEISYKETPYRIPFYIKMSVVMSWVPHKGFKLVWQAMVKIYANFIA